jgi:hypothetical protein
MSSLQRFFVWILPASVAKAMEKESRLWTMRCNVCGSETSVWDAGSIRFLAAGRPHRYWYCPPCSHGRWLEVYYKG